MKYTSQGLASPDMRHGLNKFTLLFLTEIREFELLVVHDVSLKVNMISFFPLKNLWPDDGSRPWPSSQHSQPPSQDKDRQWTSSPRLQSLRFRHWYKSDDFCTWFYVTSIWVCQERHWTVHSIAAMKVKMKIDNFNRANLVTKSWVCSLLTTMGRSGKLGVIAY